MPRYTTPTFECPVTGLQCEKLAQHMGEQQTFVDSRPSKSLARVCRDSLRDALVQSGSDEANCGLAYAEQQEVEKVIEVQNA